MNLAPPRRVSAWEDGPLRLENTGQGEPRPTVSQARTHPTTSVDRPTRPTEVCPSPATFRDCADGRVSLLIIRQTSDWPIHIFTTFTHLNTCILICMQKYSQHNKDEQTQFFRKIYPLTLYSKMVTKGLWKVMCERWVGDWKKTATYWPPALPAITALLSWRCSWCNGYPCRKWTQRLEFKSWTRMIAFHIALIPLGKVWIQLFSLQLWVNSWADWVLQPWWGN